jgi:hypothetical protein
MIDIANVPVHDKFQIITVHTTAPPSPPARWRSSCRPSHP